MKKKITIVLLLLLAFGLKLDVHPNEKDVLFFLEEYCNDFYPEHDINELIFISIKQQRLYLIRHGHVVSKHTINALDNQIPSSAADYDGTYATSSSSYISRVYIKDEDLSSTSNNTIVSAAVYDATVDFDADKVQPETGLLSVFSYINSAIEVISGTREKRDIYGNLTGET